MAKYHSYVFDIENRKFVGNFEEMYQNESKQIFDSWHQEDSRQIQRKVALSLLENFNFSHIVDLGCGKGSVTHLLKKLNNKVLGIDISETAIKFAQERYPDVAFLTADINNLEVLENILEEANKHEKVDLVFAIEVFSYLSNWQEILALLAKHTDFVLVCLYLPENPIGFVKTPEDMSKIFEKDFKVLEYITFKVGLFHLFFAQSRLSMNSFSLY